MEFLSTTATVFQVVSHAAAVVVAAVGSGLVWVLSYASGLFAYIASVCR